LCECSLWPRPGVPRPRLRLTVQLIAITAKACEIRHRINPHGGGLAASLCVRLTKVRVDLIEGLFLSACQRSLRHAEPPFRVRAHRTEYPAVPMYERPRASHPWKTVDGSRHHTISALTCNRRVSLRIQRRGRRALGPGGPPYQGWIPISAGLTFLATCRRPTQGHLSHTIDWPPQYASRPGPAL